MAKTPREAAAVLVWVGLVVGGVGVGLTFGVHILGWYLMVWAALFVVAGTFLAR
jgi:hypothetical protein